MGIEKLFFVDAETTDLPENDPDAQVIEVACATLDLATWEISGEWQTLVKHTRPMSEFTRKYFGDKDFVGALTQEEAILELLYRWQNSGHGTWAGQNPRFDLGFLQPMAKKIAMAWPTHPTVDYHVIDVSSMALPFVMLGKVESISLRSTRKWAGMKAEQSHTAFGDVMDTIAVFGKIMHAHDIQTLTQGTHFCRTLIDRIRARGF